MIEGLPIAGIQSMHIFSFFCIDDKLFTFYHFDMIRSPVEIEVRRRIKLAIWAYAYEFENVSLVSDAVFDVESYSVNLAIDTGRPDLDFWFRGYFEPCTGLWIHKHPDLSRIREIYEKHYRR